MKKLKIISLLICLLASFTSCYDEEDGKPEPKPREQVARTVLVYIVGDAGESWNELSSLLKTNFNDMKKGMEEVDYSACNLVVYSEMVDDAPHLISIKKVGDRVIADTLYTYSERNPLSKDVMSSVIEETVEYFPADSYGFVFLSHSSSWVPAGNNANARSIGYYRKTQMNIADFHDALSAFPKPLKFILFDSCLMQSAEVAYELRGCAEYLIGSPAEIPGPGAPYKVLVPELFTESDLSVNIASTYWDYYKDRYGKGMNSNDNWTAGVSISVIKSGGEALEHLALVTKDLLSKYVQNREVNGEVIDRNAILLYDFNDEANYDLDGLILYLTGGKDEADYKLWRQAFDQVVIYWKTTPSNYSGVLRGTFSMEGAKGLSICIPYGEYNSNLNKFYRTLQWYSAGGWNKTGW